MKITQNLETDEVRKCHTIEIKLSNGDEIWIYDDNDGYGSVDIDRHDHGDTSLVTSSTERPRSVRCVSLSRWDGNDTYRTTVEVGHFFDKQ